MSAVRSLSGESGRPAQLAISVEFDPTQTWLRAAVLARLSHQEREIVTLRRPDAEVIE